MFAASPGQSHMAADDLDEGQARLEFVERKGVLSDHRQRTPPGRTSRTRLATLPIDDCQA